MQNYALLIVFITLTGHIFLSLNPWSYPWYKKTTGQHTLYRAFLYGTGIFVLVFLVTAWVSDTSFAQIIGKWFANSVGRLMPTLASNIEALNLASVVALSLISAFLFPSLVKLLFWIFSKNGNYQLDAWESAAKDDVTPEFTLLAFRSISSGIPIAFTLSNNKVYIGYLREFGISSNDIQLLPMTSGYRCDEKKDLHYVINYQPVIDTILSNEGDATDEQRTAAMEKFMITIPHREIVHANLHDIGYKPHFDVHRYDKKDQIEPTSYNIEPTVESQPQIKTNWLKRVKKKWNKLKVWER